MIALSNKLKGKYNNFYLDSTEEWRMTGAIGKVENIIELKNGITFNNSIEIGVGDGNILSLLSNENFCTSLSAVEI